MRIRPLLMIAPAAVALGIAMPAATTLEGPAASSPFTNCAWVMSRPAFQKPTCACAKISRWSLLRC